MNDIIPQGNHVSETDILGCEVDDMDLAALDIYSLAQLCRQATDCFFQRVSYDDRSCIELFRRALQLQDEMAWQFLVAQYSGLVSAWIRRHPAFDSADENQEFFLNLTFANFWRVFHRDPQKFSKFSNLKSILQYLKLCAFTAVQEYVERHMQSNKLPMSEMPIEKISRSVDPIGTINSRLLANAVWEYVISTFKSEQERIVATNFLLYDMKLREIYAQHDDVFTNVEQVRRVKGNFMSRLRRDKGLLRLVAEYD